MSTPTLKVISASRRIDMVATQPEKLLHLLKTKTPPERVHTLVLWTKNPANMLNLNELYQELLKYDQLFLHLSITGFGATQFEPNVPEPEKIYDQLGDLVDLLKSPQRIRIRFDPIMHFRKTDGACVTNLHYFQTLARHLYKRNIGDVTVSWLQLYPKVIKRLQRLGITGIKQTIGQIQEQSMFLQKIAKDANITLYGCCVPEWPTSKCIDGELYNKLHPKGYRASEARAKSQRDHCGCTESWDIGWYTGCTNGCVYCYANPVVSPKNYHL